MIRFALVVSVLTACYQRDEQAESDALQRFAKEQWVKRQPPPVAPGPPVLASMNLAARARALDGAWLLPMTPDVATVALEVDGDRATVVDQDGEHDARVRWDLPCDVELTWAADPRTELSMVLEVVPADDGVRLVFSHDATVVGEQVGDQLVACSHGSLYVLDAHGACTHWARDADGWIHAADDCSFLAALPADGPRRWSAETRAYASVREPDLDAARAARADRARRTP